MWSETLGRGEQQFRRILNDLVLNEVIVLLENCSLCLETSSTADENLKRQFWSQTPHPNQLHSFYVIFQARQTSWIRYHRLRDTTGVLWWTSSRWQQLRWKAITHFICCNVWRVQRLHASFILMKVDVYSMLDGWIVDRMAEDIAEALSKNGYDVSAVSWDIDCTVHGLDEDLW